MSNWVYVDNLRGPPGPAGPPGPPGQDGLGEMVVSTDSGNASRLGTDGGIYTKEVMVKATPPVPADFGSTTIPLHAVWIVALS